MHIFYESRLLATFLFFLLLLSRRHISDSGFEEKTSSIEILESEKNQILWDQNPILGFISYPTNGKRHKCIFAAPSDIDLIFMTLLDVI